MLFVVLPLVVLLFLLLIVVLVVLFLVVLLSKEIKMLELMLTVNKCDNLYSMH